MDGKFKGTICITMALAALAFSPRADAAHATNFLNGLQSEVTNRVTSSGTNVTGTQRRALSNAARTLSRNTRTLATDLGKLASASAQLKAGYAGDATLEATQAEAVANYSTEARARMDGIYLWIGTNHLSRGLSNRVSGAASALNRAEAVTNGVSAQARALASAYNRILPVERTVRRLYPKPIVLPPPPPPPPPPGNTNPPVGIPPAIPPGTPGLAPDSVGTQYVNLEEDAVVNDQTIFYFSTAQTGAQIYSSHGPEELGLWTYIRTGANTAVMVVTPNYPSNAAPRLLNLTFTSTTGGTFSGTTFYGEALQGTLSVFP